MWICSKTRDAVPLKILLNLFALFTAVEILFYLVLVGWAAVLALVQVLPYQLKKKKLMYWWKLLILRYKKGKRLKICLKVLLTSSAQGIQWVWRISEGLRKYFGLWVSVLKYLNTCLSRHNILEPGINACFLKVPKALITKWQVER